jgi:hypothetical protein
MYEKRNNCLHGVELAQLSKWIITISMMGASAILYSAKKETHNCLFSQLYSVYFKLIFYSNTLVYWANISLTNVIQNTEQRIEK